MSNMEARYFVKNFDLVRMVAFTLLISDTSTLKIENPSVLAGLERLKKHRLSYINSDVLEEISESQKFAPDLISFLETDAEILVAALPESGRRVSFTDVKIYVDCKIEAEHWLRYLGMVFKTRTSSDVQPAACWAQ